MNLLRKETIKIYLRSFIQILKFNTFYFKKTKKKKELGFESSFLFQNDKRKIKIKK